MSDILDLVRKKKQALRAATGRRESLTKPVQGKNIFRILPGWRGAGDPTFFVDFGQHWIKDVNNKLVAVYVCVDKTFGRPCPVCESIEQGIQQSTDDAVLNALKEGKSKGKVLFNALHRNGNDPSTPVILELTPTTAEKVFELMEEYGNIIDLDEGVDIVINRTGQGLNTEYGVLPAAKSEPVDKKVLANLHNLDEYVLQEYDEGRNKALAAVSSVSGLLPPSAAAAATTASSKPAISAVTKPPVDDDEELEAVVQAAEAAAGVNKAEVDEALEGIDEPAAEADDESEPPPASDDDEMSEDELDKMLAGLS